jgi:2-polyprenyl-6-methoxyphenol hydroxylase-like FAD-dependent oxidoreductase
VVGAAPTGLTLAAQLLRFGTRFRIIDRAPARAQESRALAANHPAARRSAAATIRSASRLWPSRGSTVDAAVSRRSERSTFRGT